MNDLKLLMKVKEESAKAELYLNMKTKNMTTEEINNFNIDDEDADIVKDFAYLNSVISLKEVWSNEINRRLNLKKEGMEN